MSLFDWLLVSHLVGDFLLQTPDMAQHKAHSWPWLFRHIAAYMVLVSIVVIGYAATYRLPAWLVAAALLFLAGTHVILDRRAFTNWWIRLIPQVPEHHWLSIVVDQVFHVLTLAVVAQILVL